MTVAKLVYACTECGSESLRWEGRCAVCGEWNTLVEHKTAGRQRKRAASTAVSEPATPVRLGTADTEPPARLSSGLGEFDRALGGGLVPGALILLGGPPGVGKSTLLLQLAGRVARGGRRVLYASGEESTDQVRLRARRIGQGADEVLFIASTDVDTLLEAANETAPDLLCLDSVQTVTSGRLESSAGSVTQIRETAARVQDYAKRSGCSAVLVGHVTKGGALAGPKALEHLVDVVLHFSGRRAGGHRLLHATKNRFGSADEIGAFRMTAAGLEEVEDPSELFLAERQASVSGSALALPLQGSRALVAEVQALTTASRYSNAQRVVTGFPPRRLALLAAVLERRAGLSVAESDVFVNVVGGLRLTDPAADMALAAALASAQLDRPLPERTAYVGEVGLGGEVRGGGMLDARLRAAERAGLTEVVVPEASGNQGATDQSCAVRLHVVRSVHDVVALLRD